MSSLATAPTGAEPEPAGATPVGRNRRFGLSVDAALALLLAAGFAVVVFVATGGTDLGPNTWVEIALVIIGAGCAVAAMVIPTRGHRWGTVTVVLFAALAALTYLSIAWSVQPANSWVEANRTLAYLAAFGGAAALVRLAPARWPAVVGGVGLVAAVVCAYALLAKVFPATLDAGDVYGRLRVPFDYWNATGLMAVLGLPACLWAGARPGANRVLRTFAVPAIALLLTVLMLSYSRGALIAGVIGLACWFVLVPLRLRATLLLVLGAMGAAVATLWALAHHAITHDNASLSSRTADGHVFGIVLLAVLVLTTIAGLVAAHAMDTVVLPASVRRRISVGLLVLVAMVPVVAVAGLAASSRGLTGEVSHVWNTLTSPAAPQPGNSAARIAELGNSRSIYWREGLKVGEHAPLAGVGAGGFDTARTRYSTSQLPVAHAHSYLVETFADFGAIGLAVSLALLVAWGLAVRRTLSGARADARHEPERIGLITLLAIAIAYGVSSLIDWTWFVPGVTVPALVCAGWLAGRGPLVAPAGPTVERRRILASPGLAAAGVGLAAATVIACWFVWQPLHSANLVDSAVTAMSNGDARGALADANHAATSNPLSVDPLWELSAIYVAVKDNAAARAELVKATARQPDNPQTWEQLGSFDLQQRARTEALHELQTALRLDRTSTLIQQELAQAQAAPSTSS